MPRLHPATISHLGNEFNAGKTVFEKLRALDGSYQRKSSMRPPVSIRKPTTC